MVLETRNKVSEHIPMFCSICGLRLDGKHGNCPHSNEQGTQQIKRKKRVPSKRSKDCNSSNIAINETDVPSEDASVYCICLNNEIDSNMILCDNTNCIIKWYHYTCLGISVVPEGSWICPYCNIEIEEVNSEYESENELIFDSTIAQEDDNLDKQITNQELNFDGICKLIGKGNIDIKHSKSKEQLKNMKWDYVDTLIDDADDITEQNPTIRPVVKPYLHSVVDLFFYFFPVKFWESITRESNNYEKQARYARETKAKKKLPFSPIKPIEILNVIGLMISRTLFPHVRGFSFYWSESPLGSSVPTGTCNKVMSRNSYDKIMEFLHFTNNNDPRRTCDGAWKVRSVIEQFNKVFFILIL